MLPALETTDEINLVAAIAIRRSIIASAVTGCLSITNRTYQSNPAAAKPAHQEALYCRLHHHGRGWFGSNHKRQYIRKRCGCWEEYLVGGDRRIYQELPGCDGDQR